MNARTVGICGAKNKIMKHIGLFEGIGGFSLAARWMGWETIAWCEWNEFGQKVLRHHFPEAEGFGDITKTDFTKYANRIDILTGGFPCQPYSAAGKRLGKEDERHLWPEMLRAVREIQPRYVVGENVRGLTNWNGGMVFDEVQADLEAEGYEVLPFLLPACAINAPHRRDRIWFVAYANNAGANERSGTNGNRSQANEGREQQPQPEYRQDGGDGTIKNPDRDERYGNKREEESNIRGFRDVGTGDNERICTNDEETNATNPQSGRSGGLRNPSQKTGPQKSNISLGSVCGIPPIADTNGIRLRGQSNGLREPGQLNETSQKNDWNNFPTQSPLCGGDDGLPTGLDGITFSKWRNESIKAYGNAIVPQVAYQIFKALSHDPRRI